MNVQNVVAPELDSTTSDVLVVDTNHSSGLFSLNELWHYRSLIWIFAIRDITVRYRQTFVGIAWTVLQPLSLMLGLALFRRMVAADAVPDPIPEPVRIYCALILYQLFAAIINTSTLCLVDNRQMLTKVYFPRLVLPLAASIRPLVDFCISLIVLMGLMIWYRVPPSPMIVLAPIFVVLTVVVALAFGLWLSALNAHYRDFGHVVPFALQLGLIISPIVVDSSHVAARWRWLYFANPMASLLDAFRWTILGMAYLPGWKEMLISLVTSAFLFASGAWYFRRVDRFLADSI